MSLPVAEKAKAALTKKENKSPEKFLGINSQGVLDILNLYKSQILHVLPKAFSPERLLQIATTMIVRDKEIASCTTQSVVGAVLQCATLGLDPTPSLGLCYFIPFNNSKNNSKEIQFLLGYRGLTTLVRRTGEIKTAYAYVVHENDFFEVELGTDPTVRHKPALSNRGKLSHAYAVIKFKDGGELFEYMGKDDIDAVKLHSAASRSPKSPWNTPDVSEMWRKTVLRRACKYAPMAIDTTTGIELEKDLAADEKILNADKFDAMEKEFIEPESVETVIDPLEEKISEAQWAQLKSDCVKNIDPSSKVFSVQILADSIKSKFGLENHSGLTQRNLETITNDWFVQWQNGKFTTAIEATNAAS